MSALKQLIAGAGTTDPKTKEEIAKLEGKVNACTQKLTALQQEIKLIRKQPRGGGKADDGNES